MSGEQHAELAGRVAPGPEVDACWLARLGSDLGALVADASRGIEVSVFVVLHSEVRV